MSNSNLIFPSTKMLPMNDIKTELSEYFLGLGDKSVDTQKVADENANNIAIAAKDENGIVKDRNTVENSLKLGGVDADQYLTKEQGQNIENFGQNVSIIFADEIAALRDELYQLRGELTRNGYVKEYGLYAGFQDYFNTENKKYLYSKTLDGDQVELCKLSSNFINSTNVNKIIPSQSGLIEVGDWFIISKTDTGENYLVQATNVKKNNSEDEITFSSSISSEGIPSIDNPAKVIIAKVQGEYNHGTFSFSKTVAQTASGREKYTMLNDDTSVTLRSIKTDASGYGIQLKVPKTIQGALKEFHIIARANGTPGALTCYLLDATKYQNVTNLALEEIGEDKNVLAKSLPISYEAASSVNLTEIAFNFYNSENYTYPVIDGIQYVIVVVAESCSSENYWDIQFTTNDVQTNNIAYEYNTTTGIVNVPTLGDMIFSLVTIEIQNNVEIPMNEGLYTSQKIKVHDGEKLSRARLMLRINKEGDYVCKTNGVINNGGVIRIESNHANPNNLGISRNDILVIGTDIRKAVSDCDSNNVTIDKAISIDTNAEIYRVGYTPYLRAVKTVWDEETTSMITISDVFIPMQLKAVIKDSFKQSENRSDRLIFECELMDQDNHIVDANEFVLQIVWKANLTNDDLRTYPKYIGRIYDMSLSFDKII